MSVHGIGLLRRAEALLGPGPSAPERRAVADALIALLGAARHTGRWPPAVRAKSAAARAVASRDGTMAETLRHADPAFPARLRAAIRELLDEAERAGDAGANGVGEPSPTPPPADPEPR